MNHPLTRQDRRRTLRKVVDALGVTVDAKATSTSGRWSILSCMHQSGGLPCFDVIAVREDGAFDRHHFCPREIEESDPEQVITYDDARDMAMREARRFYEQLVAQMQEKPISEEADEGTGLTIINPDGTEEDYLAN